VDIFYQNQVFLKGTSKPIPKPIRNPKLDQNQYLRDQNYNKPNTVHIKTISKPILSTSKPYQNQYCPHQNHIKTNTQIPKPYQNPNFKAKTSKLVLVLVHA
jgi:hypothetical protein